MFVSVFGEIDGRCFQKKSAEPQLVEASVFPIYFMAPVVDRTAFPQMRYI